MPKLKTHSGAKDRFKVTGTGKLMRMKIGASHFRRNKTKSAKRFYHQKVAVDKAVKHQVRRMLGV